VTGFSWWEALAGLAIALAVVYAALIAALLLAGRRGSSVREMLRLLPDMLRLLRRLATDRTLPGSIRIRLWLLFGYLALPFDLVPDFVPVLGYADDAIIVCLVLRSVVRGAGVEVLTRHWSGTAEGLRAVVRLTGAAAPRS
jgi:uncharacterized membrane protein YkvA (DUF1232 family)